MEILSYVLPALFIVFSSFLAYKFVKKGANKKKAVLAQIISVVFIMTISLFATASATTSKQTENPQTTASTSASDVASAKANSYGIGLVAAALVTGLACIGGGIAVASAAPAAIAATSEDPKAFGKAIIFVALGEGFAIYGLLISIMILGKIDSLIS